MYLYTLWHCSSKPILPSLVTATRHKSHFLLLSLLHVHIHALPLRVCTIRASQAPPFLCIPTLASTEHQASPARHI